ncbi:hypothetical protein PEC301879_33810 [Pectobacterium carotovorum subsp. carotovorum]|nr:hypothetical protein PEC301879_33810 [Pectobacterium carotovorum subsp. carotovorum]
MNEKDGRQGCLNLLIKLIDGFYMLFFMKYFLNDLV